jgi:hypothetical protein
MRSLTPSSHSPSRKLQHIVDRNPGYSMEMEAASQTRHFRGVTRPSSAMKCAERKAFLTSSFTSTNIFPLVSGGAIIPVPGDMARQVDRERRALEAIRESPQRERCHEDLVREIHQLWSQSPAILVRAPPVPPAQSLRSTSPMMEVADSSRMTKEEAFETRGRSLVHIGGVAQPFIRPASAASGALQVVMSTSKAASSHGVAADSSSSGPDLSASSSSERGKLPLSFSPAPSLPGGGHLKVMYGQRPPRPGSSATRAETVPEECYRINVLLRSRPASGNTRPEPAEHYPLRSVVL